MAHVSLSGTPPNSPHTVPEIPRPLGQISAETRTSGWVAVGHFMHYSTSASTVSWRRPMSRGVHRERHRTQRIGWLRAAVLGANDGIVSTASLIVGVAAANAGRSEMLLAGVAGLVAGAMSMAAGEYVFVSSQVDTERADPGAGPGRARRTA